MISNNHDKSVKHVFSVFPYSFFSVFNHIPFIPGSVFFPYSWPSSPPPGLVSLHSWLSILSVFLALVSSSWPCVPSFLAQYSFRIPGPCLLLLALCPFIPGSVFFPYSWPSSPHYWLPRPLSMSSCKGIQQNDVLLIQQFQKYMNQIFKPCFGCFVI